MHIYYYTSEGNLSICMHGQECDANIPVDYASLLTNTWLDYIFIMYYGFHLSYGEIKKHCLVGKIYEVTQSQ